MINNINENNCLQAPFRNEVYLIAVTLHQRFLLRWVDVNLQVNSGIESLNKRRFELKEMIEGELR